MEGDFSAKLRFAPTSDQSNAKLTNSTLGIKPGVSSAADVRKILGKPSQEVDSVTVGQVTNLRLLAYDKLRVSVFLPRGEISLIIHVPHKGGAFPLVMTGWRDQLGQPEATLSSAHGPLAQVHLYAKAGIAVHAVAEYVQVIELFEPTSAAGYEKSFYRRVTFKR